MTVRPASAPGTAVPDRDAIRAPAASGRWSVDGPLDLAATCRRLRDGTRDPTWAIAPGRVVRALHTPDGPATMEVTLGGGAALRARAWGPGAERAVAAAPALVGLRDDRRGFRAGHHPLVARLDRLHRGLRLGATGSVLDAIAPVVLGQRVTAGEALRSWWRLARRHGPPAPGPYGLRLAPSPRSLARLGDADWHRLGVERRRADAVRGLLRVLPALERAATAGPGPLQRSLVTVPGVGPWTATGIAGRVTGDPDVVLLGDLHLPHAVCRALTGAARGSDERMLELLEPWAGQRGRVVALVLRGAHGRHDQE